MLLGSGKEPVGETLSSSSMFSGFLYRFGGTGISTRSVAAFYLFDPLVNVSAFEPDSSGMNEGETSVVGLGQLRMPRFA